MTDPTTARGPHALLDDYAAIARRRGPVALERTAIRARSASYRTLLAHVASGGALTYEELTGAARAGQLGSDTDPRWVAALGRVVGLQMLDPDTDGSTATALLRASVGGLAPGRERDLSVKLLLELLFVAREFSAYREELARADLPFAMSDHLRLDLLNPSSGSPYADEQQWLAGFSDLFTRHGLTAPGLRPDAGTRFDGLRSATTAGTTGADDLISVVMTTWCPDREPLLTSVRSILDQTWRNLELVVVDDCSPQSYDAVLDEVAAVDPRVRLIRMPRNGGTYLARNAGIAAADGFVITGQDDDDWSHPERLERQVQPILAGDADVTRSRALTADENLVLQRPGYPPERPNASSLMFRRDVALTLGGFLPSRRGADSEFHKRLDTYHGRPTVTLPQPLAVVRIRSASLSRGDFRAGWHHPARRAFRSAYEHWHRTAARADLRVDPTAPSPVPIPTRFAVDVTEPADLDVVLAGDWRKYGGPQRSMLEEIAALTARDRRVGVLHLEAARFMTPRDEPLCAQVQDLINAGRVRQVLDDEPATTRLVVLRYPPILQFPPDEPLALRADRAVVLANQAPSERDGTDIRYVPRQCADHAERVLGRRALWVPQGPTVRHALEGLLPDDELAEFDLPGIIDVDRWATDRSYFRGDRPVIGRHSRDDPMKWPERPAALTAAYPVDGSVDVRLMGGATKALDVLGTTTVPAGWVSFPKDALDVRAFLNSIDFFVYYQHSQAFDAFGRAVLEALATGCVAVLPHEFEATFGDAAVYARVDQAMKVVHRLYADPERYRRQARRAVTAVRRRFSHASYVERIDALVAGS